MVRVICLVGAIENLPKTINYGLIKEKSLQANQVGD